jgi:dihydrofolate reductase
MKITMVAVSSVDGRLTAGADPQISHWSSKEDWDHFLQIMSQHTAVVMGRKTYEAAKPAPQPERLRVVLTRHPEEFRAATVPGQLEFSSLSPVELVRDLEARGHDALMLVGGGEINAAFVGAGLVDELYLSIEPVAFGGGVTLLGKTPLFCNLQLLGMEQLNDRGTLLLHYRLADRA